MKALVLCGGIPQVALIEELKSRGIRTILADMNENVVARAYADEFYPVSVLDVDGVKNLAERKKVDFVITACADQVLLVQAQVSEMLGLPCYISYQTAKAVSSKALMKSVFVENGIPTSKHIIMREFDAKRIEDFRYPMIVKPVDSYSSRGVRKVFNLQEAKEAFEAAVEISREKRVIVEEFINGEELSVDVYVEDGEAHVLCISNIDKIPGSDRFVICRTRYPAQISEAIEEQVRDISQKIAEAFHLKNSPMLIQMIVDGERAVVVECCARTGGGDKFRLIKQVSNFDVIKAVVDLTLGEKPHVEPYRTEECIVNEFLYVNPGVIDHLQGFEEMKAQGVIYEYFQLKPKGFVCGEAKSSGDRAAYYTIRANSMDEARSLDKKANKFLKVIAADGGDMLRHDLIAAY